MRRAGQKRTASPFSPSIAQGVTAPLGSLIASDDFAADISTFEEPLAVHLSPDATFGKSMTAVSDERSKRRQHLTLIIRQRIESRLPGRIRNLAVRVAGNTVILEGQCATYYSKQLAQHAALGILERNEHLENAITVAVPR